MNKFSTIKFSSSKLSMNCWIIERRKRVSPRAQQQLPLAVSFVIYSSCKIILNLNFLISSFSKIIKSLGFPSKKRNWIEISPWQNSFNHAAFELHFTLLRYRYWTPLFHHATSFYSSPPLITWSLMIFRARKVITFHFRDNLPISK